MAEDNDGHAPWGQENGQANGKLFCTSTVEEWAGA